MQLDQRGLEILRVLSCEGRITKAALVDRIGLSPTPETIRNSVYAAQPMRI